MQISYGKTPAGVCVSRGHECAMVSFRLPVKQIFLLYSRNNFLAASCFKMFFVLEQRYGHCLIYKMYYVHDRPEILKSRN